MAPPRPPCLQGAETQRLGHGDPGNFPLSSPSVASAPTYTYLPVHLSVISLSIHLSVTYPWISLSSVIHVLSIIHQSSINRPVSYLSCLSVCHLSFICHLTVQLLMGA